MKKLIKLFIIITLSLTILNCKNSPKCFDYKKVLDIEPYHTTRVFVTYISKCNDTIRTSEHWSRVVVCENGTFDFGDYINGRKPYGVIK